MSETLEARLVDEDELDPVEAKLPDAQEAWAKAEWPFVVGLIPLRDIVIDERYQRPVQEHFVKGMIENFDESLVGVIDVSAREDKSYAVLDGQQRTKAMTARGKHFCYAAIYEDLSIEDEAGFFYRKNKDRRWMKPYYAFRARAVAKDPEAVAIEATITAAGFRLGETTDHRDVISSVTAIESAWSYTSGHRDESLTPTLGTIKKAFYGQRDSLSNQVVLGLARFWQTFADDQVRADILADALNQLGGSAQLRNRARARVENLPGQSVTWAVARTVVDEYNRLLREKEFPGAKGSFAGRLDPRELQG